MFALKAVGVNLSAVLYTVVTSNAGIALSQNYARICSTDSNLKHSGGEEADSDFQV